MPLVNARLARAYTTNIRASIQEAGAFFLPRAKSMAAKTVGVVGLRRHFQLSCSPVVAPLHWRKIVGAYMTTASTIITGDRILGSS